MRVIGDRRRILSWLQTTVGVCLTDVSRVQVIGDGWTLSQAGEPWHKLEMTWEVEFDDPENEGLIGEETWVRKCLTDQWTCVRMPKGQWPGPLAPIEAWLNENAGRQASDNDWQQAEEQNAGWFRLYITFWFRDPGIATMFIMRWL